MFILIQCPSSGVMGALCQERRWLMNGWPGHLDIPSRLTATVDEFCIFNRALAPEEIKELAGR